MNYSVSPSSPTDELFTLGQIFSEVGDYASTILDREHLSLSRRCVTRLNKVVDELVSRQCILSAENLYDVPESEPANKDLKSLNIDELHTLYRRWPLRHNDRRTKGRESMSFYYEGQIAREIMSRKGTNKGEKFKIDYCTAMYSNELSNMSYLFSCPIQIDNDKIYPDRERPYSPEELTALIRLYKDYRDVTERELLVEYVDYALDWLEKNQVASSGLSLLTELAEIRRRKIIRVPEWVNKRLVDAAAAADKDGETALALLTLQIINNDQSLERRAQRIINRCYRQAFEDSSELDERIEDLHTAVTCCDYVTRFSVRKAASLWNELSGKALSSDMELKPKQIFQLLEIAKECEDYANISLDSKDALKRILEKLAQFDSLEAKAYSRIVRLRF